MSDPWSEELPANKADEQPRLPLAHSAPEYGEADPSFSTAEPAEKPATKKPWQFSLGRLQMVIVVLCLSSACLGALIHAQEDDFTTVAILLLILPSGVLILLGIGRGSYELYKTWREDRALWHQQPWQSNQTTLPPEDRPGDR